MENQSEQAARPDVEDASDIEEAVSAFEATDVPVEGETATTEEQRPETGYAPLSDKPARSIADKISDIGSAQDVKDIIDDGLDRLKGVTVDDAIETGKSLASRLLKRVGAGFDEATRKD